MTSDTNPIIRCPNCGGRDVRPSMAHGLWDTIMGALHRSPMRCRQCHNRFHPRILKKEEDETEEEETEEEDVKPSEKN